MSDTPATPAIPSTQAPAKTVVVEMQWRWRRWLAAAIASMLLIGAGFAAFVYVEYQSVRRLERLIDISTPPTNDKLFTILSKGVGITEDEYRTDATGAAPEAAFTTDLTTAQQTDAFTQEALISNIDTNTPAQIVCVKPIAWSSPGASCTLKCAASTVTCSGAATDGLHLSPGQMISRRWDGTNCVCVMGSVNPTAYQTERVVR